MSSQSPDGADRLGWTWPWHISWLDENGPFPSKESSKVPARLLKGGWGWERTLTMVTELTGMKHRCGWSTTEHHCGIYYNLLYSAKHRNHPDLVNAGTWTTSLHNPTSHTVWLCRIIHEISSKPSCDGGSHHAQSVWHSLNEDASAARRGHDK